MKSKISYSYECRHRLQMFAIQSLYKDKGEPLRDPSPRRGCIIVRNSLIVNYGEEGGYRRGRVTRAAALQTG